MADFSVCLLCFSPRRFSARHASAERERVQANPTILACATEDGQTWNFSRAVSCGGARRAVVAAQGTHHVAPVARVRSHSAPSRFFPLRKTGLLKTTTGRNHRFPGATSSRIKRPQTSRPDIRRGRIIVNTAAPRLDEVQCAPDNDGVCRYRYRNASGEARA
jgi:hypothetical protein